MVPSIDVMPREGSFALASFGRVRKVHETAFSLSAGRKSFALKRIEVLVTLLGITEQVPGKQQLIHAPRRFYTALAAVRITSSTTSGFESIGTWLLSSFRGGGAHPLCHKTFQIRVDGAVVLAHDVPARL